MSRFLKTWTEYWFEPGSLRDLAIFRIGVVGVQLLYILPLKWNDIALSAGYPDSLFEPILMLRILTLDLASTFRPPHELLVALFSLAIVSGVGSLIGWRTNIWLAILALTSLFIQAFLFSFGEMHHAQAAILIALGLLAVSPSGARLSIDSLRRESDAVSGVSLEYASATSPYAGWPLKLMLWIFALFYLSGDISKLALWTLESGGFGSISFDWVNGYTLQYYLAQDALRWTGRFGGDVALWLSQHHVFVLTTQWALVVFQGLFWLAIPFPRLLWIFIPVGLLFHGGNWFLLRAPFPQWLACYIAFIPWSAGLDLLKHRAAARADSSRRLAESLEINTVWLVYDGDCPFCSRYSRLVQIRDRVGDFRLLNARDAHPVVSEVRSKFDLDVGMVLKIGDLYFHGDQCIYVLAILSEPKGVFGALNAAIFRSPTLAKALYPILRFGRNLSLRLLGRRSLRHA